MSFVITKNDPGLHRAVRRNDISKIKRLLQSDQFDVNAEDIKGNTPLHVAAFKNKDNSHQEAIRILLNYRADVDAQDPLGNTALHYFVSSSNSPIILDLFINFGANIDVENEAVEMKLHCSNQCTILTTILTKMSLR